jgi:hypothetical protein
LDDGHIDQLIKGICPYQVQSLLELGIETAAKTVSLLSVAIRMITRILAQVIESLCILHDSASPLSES